MIPKNNRAYWHHKFALNKARDTKAQVALRKAGYRTLVVWECELAAGRALRRFASFLAQSNSDLFRDRARKLRRY
jgi:DNA mismatch endonuclease (patch repair protein)